MGDGGNHKLECHECLQNYGYVFLLFKRKNAKYSGFDI